MPVEYEYSFVKFDKKTIIDKIKENNGEYIGTYIFRVQVFIHPFNAKGTYIRVRDEGHRITMTYKRKNFKTKFDDEYEIKIDNFDTAINMLVGIGCKKKYYYEKIREIWKLKNTEIVFDTNPGIEDRMEIESNTQDELNEMVTLFNLKQEGNIPNRYMSQFGITIPQSIDLTFTNVKNDLIESVTKNKEQFIELVDNQLERFNALKITI